VVDTTWVREIGTSAGVVLEALGSWDQAKAHQMVDRFASGAAHLRVLCDGPGSIQGCEKGKGGDCFPPFTLGTWQQRRQIGVEIPD
jgi:hypothetical protein